MSTVPLPRSFVPLSPGDEALELRDIGAADLSPTPTPDVLGSVVTWADVEQMAAARPVARPAGYRDALCVACSCALYVPAEATGDILCEGCRREGEALAAAEDGDDDPDRPNSSALRAQYAAELERWSDDFLVTGVAMVDEGKASLWFKNDAEREAWTAAATDEIRRRLERGGLPLAA